MSRKGEERGNERKDWDGQPSLMASEEAESQHSHVNRLEMQTGGIND